MAEHKDGKVKVINAETHEEIQPHQKMNAVDEAKIKALVGEEEDTSETSQANEAETNTAESKAEETQDTTKTEEGEATVTETAEASEKTKRLSDKEFQDLLNQSLGQSEAKASEDVDVDAVLKENEQLKRDKAIRSEAEMIDGLLSKLPDSERSLMEAEIEKMFKEGFYKDRAEWSPEKRIKDLFKQARGGITESLAEMKAKQILEQKQNESVLGQHRKAGKPVDRSEAELDELKSRALNRDREAGIELYARQRDPVLEKLIQNDADRENF